MSIVDLNNSMWLIIGIALCIVIVFSFKFFFNRDNHQQKGNIKGEGNSQVFGEHNTSYNNVQTVNNITTQSVLPNQEFPKAEVTIEDIKANLRILFVDDKDDFKIIEMLKDVGYHVDYREDIKDIHDSVVKYAHVIFLDINGVGLAMGFKNQGMGLCGAIKKQYGDSKRVVLYSGETSGSIFDADAKKADATLPKDSDLYQFTSYITQYGKELL